MHCHWLFTVSHQWEPALMALWSNALPLTAHSLSLLKAYHDSRVVQVLLFPPPFTTGLSWFSMNIVESEDLSEIPNNKLILFMPSAIKDLAILVMAVCTLHHLFLFEGGIFIRSKPTILLNPLSCWLLIWPIQNDAKNWKYLKPWQMGTHLRVLDKSYPMNTNIAGFRWFSNFFLHSCALEEISLSIGRVNMIDGFMQCFIVVFESIIDPEELLTLLVYQCSSSVWPCGLNPRMHALRFPWKYGMHD